MINRLCFRFAFLKAFLLDREGLASIKVEPYYEECLGDLTISAITNIRLLAFLVYSRLSETKEKETFTELPLCLIREKYEHLPGGPAFIKSILDSDLALLFHTSKVQKLAPIISVRIPSSIKPRPDWEKASAIRCGEHDDLQSV